MQTDVKVSGVSHLSQVQFEHIADVVRRGLGKLHQLFAVLKRLTQLLHSCLHSIYTVYSLKHHSHTHI